MARAAAWSAPIHTRAVAAARVVKQSTMFPACAATHSGGLCAGTGVSPMTITRAPERRRAASVRVSPLCHRAAVTV